MIFVNYEFDGFLKRIQKMAGMARFELATNRLTVYCATAAPHPSNLK